MPDAAAAACDAGHEPPAAEEPAASAGSDADPDAGAPSAEVAGGTAQAVAVQADKEADGGASADAPAAPEALLAAAQVVVKEEPAPAAVAPEAEMEPPSLAAPTSLPPAAAAVGKKDIKVDVANLGKGSGLMGDDDGLFVPQASPAPSLSQYSAKAKEADARIELNKYDVDAWKSLLSEVQVGSMKHLAGEVYERVCFARVSLSAAASRRLN